MPRSLLRSLVRSGRSAPRARPSRPSARGWLSRMEGCRFADRSRGLNTLLAGDLVRHARARRTGSERRSLDGASGRDERIKPEGVTPMNPNKALWEKATLRALRRSMRESGEALVKSLGITKGSRFWISDAAMERRHCQRRSSERRCWASISRGTSLRPTTKRGKEQGHELKFCEGDASNLQN